MLLIFIYEGFACSFNNSYDPASDFVSFFSVTLVLGDGMNQLQWPLLFGYFMALGAIKHADKSLVLVDYAIMP